MGFKQVDQLFDGEDLNRWRIRPAPSCSNVIVIVSRDGSVSFGRQIYKIK